MIQYNLLGTVDILDDNDEIIITMTKEQLEAIKKLNLISIKENCKLEGNENTSTTIISYFICVL